MSTERSQEGTRPGTREADRVVFRELHDADHGFRAMDLAENIAAQRRHSLAATSKPSYYPQADADALYVAVSTGGPQDRNAWRISHGVLDGGRVTKGF